MHLRAQNISESQEQHYIVDVLNFSTQQFKEFLQTSSDRFNLEAQNRHINENVLHDEGARNVVDDDEIRGNASDNTVDPSIPPDFVEPESVMDASTVVNGMHGNAAIDHADVGQTIPTNTDEPTDVMHVANGDEINATTNDGVVLPPVLPRLRRRAAATPAAAVHVPSYVQRNRTTRSGRVINPPQWFRLSPPARRGRSRSRSRRRNTRRHRMQHQIESQEQGQQVRRTPPRPSGNEVGDTSNHNEHEFQAQVQHLRQTPPRPSGTEVGDASHPMQAESQEQEQHPRQTSLGPAGTEVGDAREHFQHTHPGSSNPEGVHLTGSPEDDGGQRTEDEDITDCKECIKKILKIIDTKSIRDVDVVNFLRDKASTL